MKSGENGGEIRYLQNICRFASAPQSVAGRAVSSNGKEPRSLRN